MMGLRLAASAALAFGAVGCLSPIAATDLVPREPAFIGVELRSDDRAIVRVDAGPRERTSQDAFELRAEVFRDALVQALELHGPWKPTADPNAAHYALDVTLISVREPSSGLAMTSSVVAEWKVSTQPAGTALADEFVEGTSSAGIGDAFDGGKRKRIAIEWAARDNIKRGLVILSRIPKRGAAQPGRE